jgi:hypothetical protein
VCWRTLCGKITHEHHALCAQIHQTTITNIHKSVFFHLAAQGLTLSTRSRVPWIRIHIKSQVMIPRHDDFCRVRKRPNCHALNGQHHVGLLSNVCPRKISREFVRQTETQVTTTVMHQHQDSVRVLKEKSQRNCLPARHTRLLTKFVELYYVGGDTNVGKVACVVKN